MDIFDKISARLTDLGMTQADLARATGISTGLFHVSAPCVGSAAI